MNPAEDLPSELDLDAIAAFCERNHIRKLSLFGSILREDFGPDSDIDVLVEFEPGKTPGFAFLAMERQLGLLLDRRVDLNVADDLSRHFREQVIHSAAPVYVAA